MAITWLHVTVRTGAKERSVEKLGAEDHYIVRTTTTPEKGKANKDVLRLLAEHLDVPVSSLQLAKGATTNKKIIELKT